MNPETWQRIQELFLAALEQDPTDRSSYLDQACGGDLSLRAEVERLLRSDENAGRFLEEVVLTGAAALSENSAGSMVGHMVGPYKIQTLIGQGGMSTVYLAVRADDQFQKRVALKLVKRGMDTEEILRRFRTERQILAGLDHPNIALLFDGGTFNDGLPYFAMEFIEGVRIDEYCDDHRLTIDQRLELFCTVCSAVHYAHQNLVVHRDIKPANILVTVDGVPKLLDFGIAKLLNPDLSGQTMQYTLMGQGLLTPEFASPEQIRGRTITTSSDVYSLGVLLYLLLTGHHPYRLEGRHPQEIERAVCDTEPTRPSLTVNRVEETVSSDGTPTKLTPESVSQARDEQPDRLRRKLAGDLDTIVLMALRKDPQRRYASVLQFSEDIRRYRDGRMVTARKDTVRYRTGKFIRRNKTGSVLLALILVFTAAMTVQSIRLKRERDHAAIERDKAEEVSAMLVRIFQISDPSNSNRGETITAREILDQSAARIERELANQPEVRARLMETMGEVYQNLGLYNRADHFLREALTLRRQRLGDEHIEVAASMQSLGSLLLSEADYRGADSLLHKSLDLRRKLLGRENLDVATTMSKLAEVMKETGRYSEAESLGRATLVMRQQLLGPEHTEVAKSMTTLAGIFEETDRYPEAESLEHKALEMRRRLLGPEHIDVARSLNGLGRVLFQEGEYDRAEPLFRQSLNMERRLLGADSSEVASVLNRLAMIRAFKGDSKEAEKLYRDVITVQKRTLGEEHPKVASTMINLAGFLVHEGRTYEADSLCRRAIQIKQRALGNDHPEVAKGFTILAWALENRGDNDEAMEFYRQSIAIYRKKLPRGHSDLCFPLQHLGILLTEKNELSAAEPLLRENLQLSQKGRFPPEYVAEAACALGGWSAKMKRYPEAESLLVPYSSTLLNNPEESVKAKVQCLDWIIGMYKSWGKPERMATYQSKRTALAAQVTLATAGGR